MRVFRNQGWRDAWTLAELGDEQLIEYEMPNGTTSLNIVPKSYEARCKLHQYRAIAYKALPKKWIVAMYDYGTTSWEGAGQGRSRREPVQFPEDPRPVETYPVRELERDVPETLVEATPEKVREYREMEATIVQYVAENARFDVFPFSVLWNGREFRSSQHVRSVARSDLAEQILRFLRQYAG